MRVDIDYVYMVIRLGDVNYLDEEHSVIYAAPGSTAQEAWNNVEEMPDRPTIWNRDYLRKQGYRAKGITISIEIAEGTG